MFIRSERLFLRPGWPEDWEELLGSIGDERIVRNLSRVPWPYSGEDARSFLEIPPTPLFPRFLMTVPGAGGARIVGGIGLNNHGAGAELGYWVARDHWGRGYASEAARAVLDLSRTLGHTRITARHLIDNPASGRVLEKAGFRRTGRTVEVFSKARGGVFPGREYECILESADDCGDDDALMRCRRAA